MIRGLGQEVALDEEPLNLSRSMGFYLILGCLAGVVFRSLEYFFYLLIYKGLSLDKTILASAVMCLLALMTLISAGVLCHLWMSDLPFTWLNFEAMLLNWENALLLSYFV